ncbi:kininogen-1 [Heterodontus francisci]|uniref:kininogen-1 n=1 Tax=Heterodontus francisci TaxID=7792 RepID=UPI00355C88C8
MKLLYIVLFTIQLLYINAESEPLLDSMSTEDPSALVIDCNNPEALAAVDFALRKFNAERKEGHQYALYRVTDAEVEGKYGRRYFIEFSIRETDCPVGNGKIWKQCNYRAPKEATIGHCEANVYIHKTQRTTEVTEYNCTLSSDHHSQIDPQTAPCLGCQMDLPVEHSQLNETLDLSIQKFNTESNHANYFQRDTVFKFTHQVVAGIKYKLKFSMRETECSKTNSDNIASECNVKLDGMKLFCNSTVLIQIWLNFTEISVACDTQPFNQATAFALRYGGWGPFTFPAIPTSQTESGEAGANSDELFSTEKELEPLTCPGKPWRPLRQIKPAGPPAEEHHEGNKPTQTTIRDLDLLDLQ